MRIYNMKVCGFTEPIGFAVEPLRLSWKVCETEGKKQASARVMIGTCPCLSEPLYDSGECEAIDSLCFTPEIKLEPRTRYYWKVTVKADNGDVAEGKSFFETGKMEEDWNAAWIASDIRENVCFGKTFNIVKPVKRARAYATALGVYELYLNEVKSGDEYLAPYYNDYDSWLQISAFDITPLLRQGDNAIRFSMGGGWAVSRFGLGYKGEIGIDKLYADHEALLAEFRIEYEDGTEEVIGTDASWFATESKVRASSIYDGELYDATYDVSKHSPVLLDTQTDFSRLQDRLSLPLRVTERIKPIKLIETPKGELVIDLGQEITGWLEFVCRAPKGTEIKLSYSEILQDDCFYRDNLRSAKEEYTFISDGTEQIARPYHTFFGFRLVKVEGLKKEEIDLNDFTGCVLHSDIERIGFVETSNAKVNRLALNALWGQRGNFVDTPTDCPQRDERLGWTGDAQAFSGTACFNMDCQAFFTKYLHDMLFEQNKHGGSTPHIIPAAGMRCDAGSCAWGDAATVIPWNIYTFYGDKTLLKATYPNMKGWVDWIHKTEEAAGCGRLWKVGFHFADWLALDTKNNSVFGATDPYFVASGYYYYSTSLVLKAAKALGYEADVETYGKLLEEIYEAIQNEYFTPNGLMAQTTQTAYVCALFMCFAPEKHRAKLAGLLNAELDATDGFLRTGFVGTAYLNRVLTNNGYNRRAYQLLLNEKYPGWLYEVNMGATTVWERWNSVLENGKISDTGMNSLNHYAYGAIMEWVYRDVAGINPVEDAPGFRKALLKPNPDYLLPKVSAKYESAMGLYESSWEIKKNLFVWDVKVPFGAEAKLVFPNGDAETLAKACPDLKFETCACCGNATATVPAGSYHFEYKPYKPLHRILSLDMPITEFLESAEAVEALCELNPEVGKFMNGTKEHARPDMTLRAAIEQIGFLGPVIPEGFIDQLNEKLLALN